MNRRGMWVSAVLVAGVLASQSAFAADAAPTTRTDVEPSNGVPFKFRTGFFVESQIGVFTAMGGSKTFSNAQAYVGLSVGWDMPLHARALSHLGFFLTAAQGPNAGSCRTVDENGCAAPDDGNSTGLNAVENFSVIPIEVGGRLGFAELLPRFYPYVVATIGYSILTPKLYDGAAGGSMHIGVGAGVQYGTRLDGLAVGLEVLFRDAFSPSVPSLSIFPRITYVF